MVENLMHEWGLVDIIDKGICKFSCLLGLIQLESNHVGLCMNKLDLTLNLT